MLIVVRVQLLQLMNSTLRGVTNGVEIAMAQASVVVKRDNTIYIFGFELGFIFYDTVCSSS